MAPLLFAEKTGRNYVKWEISFAEVVERLIGC